MHRLVLGSLGAIAIVAGCAPPAAPTGCASVDGRAGTCAVGETCASSLDCASSNCDGGTCASGCTRAADCASGEICVSEPDAPGTRRHCTASCPTSTFHVVGDTGGLVCVDGVLRACDTLTDRGAACDVCGCEAGARCFDPEGVECRVAMRACACVPPQPVGRPCVANVGCLSFNCSGSDTSASRHCEVPAGTPCDATTDCVQCDVPTDGAPVCRQSCERDADCSTGLCVPSTTMPGELGCFSECTLDAHCGVHEHCVALEGDARGRRYCAPAPG